MPSFNGLHGRALEWGERIPLGIIYKNHRLILEERIPVIRDSPLVRHAFDSSRIARVARIERLLKEFH